jgi:plasmid stability protein
MIQLRNVPDALHRTLKVRAAMAGMSLSDYLLAEIRKIAELPTLAEFRKNFRGGFSCYRGMQAPHKSDKA